MDARLPIRRKTDTTSEIGINVVSSVVNDGLGWIFRRTHEEHDYGVDAFIDYVTPDGGVTGRFVAVQIKTGESYLKKSEDVHWYRDTREHLNYFLNLPVPVLVMICDPHSRRCYWEHLRSEKIEITGETWRLAIPKSNIFSPGSREMLAPLFGESRDHAALLEADASLAETISKNTLVLYSVTREDIENNSIQNLQGYIRRLTESEFLARTVQGKLCVAVSGYESDDREVYQVREVRRWAKKARRKISEWYLCTNSDPRFSTLTWLAACTCHVRAELKHKPTGELAYRIEFDREELGVFIEECFDGLNDATTKWGWSDEVNEAISKEITRELLPDFHGK